MTMREKYRSQFLREYQDAAEEHSRLNTMFKNVMWYNFETHCRSWGPPWPKSVANSIVRMPSARHRRFFSRGKLISRTDRGWWYVGCVSDAPQLPPMILLNEVRLAKVEVTRCEQQLTATDDWAPGGKLYMELARKYRKRPLEG